MDGLNRLLARLSGLLAEDSLNYAMSAEIYPAAGMAGQAVEKVVAQALGRPVVLGGTFGSSPAEVLRSVAEGLEYRGDGSSHPNPRAHGSPEFESLRAGVLSELEKLLQKSDQVIGLWIRDGHPFYPVFWDYAYVVEAGRDAYVLIGSSSD